MKKTIVIQKSVVVEDDLHEKSAWIPALKKNLKQEWETHRDGTKKCPTGGSKSYDESARAWRSRAKF